MLQILEEHKQQGVEHQALERGDEGKKAAAKKELQNQVTDSHSFLQLIPQPFFQPLEETSVAGGGQR